MILSFCDEPSILEVMNIVNIVITIIKVVVPILLIVSAMIDLVRAISDAELNKITKPMVNKVIAAVLVFLIPTFVSLIAKITLNDGEYKNCIDVSSSTVKVAYNNKEEELIKKAEESLDINDYNNALIYLNNLKDENARIEYTKKLEEIKKEMDSKKEESESTTPSTVADSGILKIYYFGIGRFDGHLIIGNNTTLFIDGGYVSQAKKVIPYIKSLGITKIDGLIGSHMHNNHIDAHKEFIKEFNIGSVYYGENPGECLAKKTCIQRSSDPTELMKMVKEKNIPMHIMNLGLNQKIGNLTFDIVAPNGLVSSGGYPENTNSVNMILKFGNHKFYFSGDHVRTNEILNSYDKSVLDVDIFKWPHHGLENVSNSFLDVLSPSYIIVPNGSLQDASKKGISHTNAKGYATGSDGYVLAESDGKVLTVTRVNSR